MARTSERGTKRRRTATRAAPASRNVSAALASARGPRPVRYVARNGTEDAQHQGFEEELPRGHAPLEHIPEWGPDGIGNYFAWRTASEAAFKSMPRETAVRRAVKAASIGLTFEEYQLEILERGRYLQLEDTARIAEILPRRTSR